MCFIEEFLVVKALLNHSANSLNGDSVQKIPMAENPNDFFVFGGTHAIERSPGYRPSHLLLPLQSLRGCWQNQRGPDPVCLRAASGVTPGEAELCLESWSRDVGSG